MQRSLGDILIPKFIDKLYSFIQPIILPRKMTVGSFYTKSICFCSNLFRKRIYF